MKPNMQELLIFKGRTGGHYLILQTRADAPAGYQALQVNKNAKKIAQVVACFSDELYRSNEHLNYIKVLVNINKVVNDSVVIEALQKAILQEKLTVYKDIPKDVNPGSESILSAVIAAASSLLIAETSAEGAEDENTKNSGSSTSAVQSDTAASDQATCGDPISMLTGEELLTLQDFELPGLFPLVWSRSYRSSKIKTNTGLGYGWRHSFSLQLFERYQAPPKVGPKQPGTHWFELVDEEGTVHHFNRVKKGQTSYQPSAGLALLHDGNERQILIRTDGTHWTFIKVDTVWHLVSINNELGNELKLVYDNQHRLISIATADNRGIVLRYNSDNNIIRIAPYVIDKKEKLQVSTQLLASYQYNNDHALIAAINSQGASEQYKYTAVALLKQRTRPSGFSHYFDWVGDDEHAKCCRQWGDDDTYDYHFTFEGNKSTSTDSLGNTEQYFHNQQNLLTLFIDANGNQTEHQYDHLGRKTSTTDAMGQTTAFDYNQAGQLVQQIAADNSITRYVYNAFGKRIAVIDALGRQFKRHFNATGRLLSETEPDGQTTEYKYNDKGHLSEKIMPDGQKTLYQWNDNGELLAEKSGEALTRYSYDKLGHLNAICDAQDLITEYQRNEQGQITQQVSYPQAEATADKTFPDSAVITRYVYDNAGRLTNIVSPNGESTHYGYGGLAQPTKKTFADGSWLNYQYDKERNLIGIERSDEATYHIEYSPTEKPTKLIGFDGRVQTYQYDNNDKLIEISDADERIIQLKRDALGRITDQHSFVIGKHAQPQFNHHNLYQYDAIGRVTIAHNNDSMVQQQFHANGQVSQSKQGQFTLDYAFNEQGKRSLLNLPDGQKVTYQYNEQGLLSELALVDELNSQNNLLTLEYDASGLTKKQYLGNGITLSQEHDAQSRLTKQSWLTTSEASQQRTYQYDKQNQLIAVNEFQQTNDDEKQQPTTQHFIYNKISQLVNSHTSQSEITKENKVTEHNNAESYQWDAFGNPKVDLSIPESEREIIVKSDRLHCFSGIDFSYDKSGNQISSIATGIIQKRSFDGLNQLRKIIHNGKLTHYEYDALGRRIAKITEAGKTDFIWDGNQLIGEYVNGQYTWYIYLPDSFLPIAMLKNNEIYYYHLDQLGTPVCLTDKNESIVWQNQTCLYGFVCKESDINNELNQIDNPLRFQGQYFDIESGLHYNRFRYYCPKQQRFIHQDPIGLVGGINHYQYVPNPVNWVDPYGLCAKEDNQIGVINGVVGTGDLIVIGVANTAVDIVAGIAGLAALGVSGGNVNTSTNVISSIQKYQVGPITDAGELVGGKVAPYVQEYYVDNMDAFGDATLEATGSPLLATLANKSVEIGATLVGGKTLLSSAKGSLTKNTLFKKVALNDIDLAKTKGSSLSQIQARKNVALDYMTKNGFTNDNIADALGSSTKNGGIDLTKPIEIMKFPPPESMTQYVNSHGYPGNWFDPLSNQTPDMLGISGEGRTLKSFKVVEGTGLKSTAKAVIDDWTTEGKLVPTKGGGTQLFVNDSIKAEISKINIKGI